MTTNLDVRTTAVPVRRVIRWDGQVDRTMFEEDLFRTVVDSDSAVEINLASVKAISGPAIALLLEACFVARQRGRRLLLTDCRNETLLRLNLCGVLDLADAERIDREPVWLTVATGSPIVARHSTLATRLGHMLMIALSRRRRPVR